VTSAGLLGPVSASACVRKPGHRARRHPGPHPGCPRDAAARAVPGLARRSRC